MWQFKKLTSSHSQIRFLLWIQFAIITCLDMTDPYWPLIIHHLEKSIGVGRLQFWASAIYVIPTVIAIAISPLWCKLGDKTGHKKMLVRATAALMITQLLIGFSIQLWVILTLKILQGVFAGFSVAAQAWSVNISSDKSQARIIGDTQSVVVAGAIVGPILGGLIASYINYQAIFMISAFIIFLTMIMVVCGLRETSRPVIATTLLAVKNKLKLPQYIAIWLILICLIQIARWMSNNFFPLYITLYFHQPSFMVGIFYALIAGMLISATKVLGLVLDKLKKKKALYIIFTIAAFTAAGAQCLYAFADSLVWVWCASIGWGISLGTLSVLSFAFLFKKTAQSNTKLLGWGNSMVKLGNLLGVGIGSMLYAHFNFFYSFIAIALLYLFISGSMFFFQIKRFDSIYVSISVDES